MNAGVLQQAEWLNGDDRKRDLAVRPIAVRLGLVLSFAAAVLFQVSFSVEALWPMVLGYLGILFALRRLATPRLAFYLGMLTGMGVFVPQMMFLWRIFNVAAVPLWVILAAFHGVFVLVLGRVQFRWGSGAAWIAAPVLWCGMEYFRSEVWWLRFSWFTAGSGLPPGARGLLSPLGVYGVGAVGMFVAATACRLVECAAYRRRPVGWILVGGAVAAGVAGLLWPDWRSGAQAPGGGIPVAGVQLEIPGVPEVRVALDRLARSHPESRMAMLSEYTFDEGVPESVALWCRRNGKFLVAGGRETLPAGEVGGGSLWSWLPGGKSMTAGGGGESSRFYNTAFVIGPDGAVVHRQAKSRPIQFFRDGEPARSQQVWESPWGRLGILICYDASYRRVTDPLVRQGAQALLIPTMDLETWGEHQHRLNARMARLRAAELGIPIFRVASSGISQLLDATGLERAIAPFPGSGERIAGSLALNLGRRPLPVDAWVAPACTFASAGVILGLVLPKRWFHRSRPSPGAVPSSLP